ncbi:MAG: recombinase RecT [Gammaproteobacteria bacterium]
MTKDKKDAKAKPEEQAVANQEETAPPAPRPPAVPVLAGKRGLELCSLDEMRRFSAWVAQSSFCPKGMQGKEGDVMCAIQFGAEVGLPPMQSIQDIAVINGRPSLWGDALLGLVMQSGLCDSIKETFSGNKFDDGYGWTCSVKRKGVEDAVVRSFAVADAKRAKKWGTDGPWTTYPDRMLLFRARGFALRDLFPDVLKGLISREEAMDMPPETITVVNEAEAPKTIADLTDKMAVEDEAIKAEPADDLPQETEGGDENDKPAISSRRSGEHKGTDATQQVKGGDTDDSAAKTTGSDNEDAGQAQSDEETPVKGGDANPELF